jgi:hypothetical protein
MAEDGVELTFSGYIFFKEDTIQTSTEDIYLKITLYRDDQPYGAPEFIYTINAGQPLSDEKLDYSFNFTRNFIKNNVGSTFTLFSAASYRRNFNFWDPVYYLSSIENTITQYPLPGKQPSITIPSNMWVSSSGNGDYMMYTTQSDMVNTFYTNLSLPTWYMKDITAPTASGFNPILTYWGVERGDVFRFEGDEAKTYMVNYVETGSVGGNDSVNVYFGAPIPPSLNINHYSLVRYVDDASKVILKGYRPSNSTGPYIVRPEYVVPELNKGIDAFIVDLTQKGLL